MQIIDKKKKRALVGMSGGVDSSVTAALLKREGYEVVGITITSVKITEDCKVENSKVGCCNYQGLIDAADVADQLGIEHHIVDLSDVFKQTIIQNFIDEYLGGRTPNPCAICNPLIKWGEILKKAKEYECELYATGHYAKIIFDTASKRYYIRQAKDKTKDQSYFLWGLTQQQLSRTIFPLGDLLKTEVRQIANELNLKVKNKIDSQEICFIPSNNYRDFIVKNVGDRVNKIGNIVFRGVVVGKHSGYINYTIGQRRGLGISYHQPLYVKQIIPETNTVVVDTEENLVCQSLVASNVIFMKYEQIPDSVFLAKIRYKDKGSLVKCKVDDFGSLVVEFIEPKKAVTPGQSVVVYDGEDIVAGGVIDNTEYIVKE